MQRTMLMSAIFLLCCVMLVHCLWKCNPTAQTEPTQEPHIDPVQFPHIKGNETDKERKEDEEDSKPLPPPICNESSTEMSELTYDNLECESWEREYVTAIVNPAEATQNNTFHVNAPKGVKFSYQNTTYDQCGLLRRLKETNPWIPIDIYLGPTKEVLYEFELAPGKTAIVVNKHTSCARPERISSSSTLLHFHFYVHIEAHMIEIPSLKLTSNCRDYYYKIKDKTYDNNGTEDNMGKEWIHVAVKLADRWPLSRGDKYDHYNNHDEIYISRNAPYLLSIVNKMVDFFAKQNPSETTKLRWTRRMALARSGWGIFYDYELKFTVPSKRKIELYRLVATCDEYTIYFDQVFYRIYDLNMKCIGKPNPKGIEDCNFCPQKVPNSFEIILKDGPC